MNMVMQFVNNLTGTVTKNPAASGLLLVAALLLELAWCFFGYKAMRTFSAITGFVIGAGIGLGLSPLFHLVGIVALVVPLVIGAVLAVLGFFLYKVGAFLAVLITGSGAAASLLTRYLPLNKTLIAILAAVIGLVLAVLTVVFLRAMLIVASAFAGGFGFTSLLLDNLIRIRWNTTYEAAARCGIGLILAVIGMIYQFRSTRPRRR
jgi:hypothetical protein